jgi:hypothetical protein
MASKKVLAALILVMSGCSPSSESNDNSASGSPKNEADSLSQLDSSKIDELAGNKAHNKLAKQTGLERAMALANVVKTLENKQYCSPEKTLFRGVGEGKSFWSIQCHDGESFQVIINPDGSGGTLNCATMKLVEAGDCWTPFDKK